MKMETYQVWFTNDNYNQQCEIVTAGCESDAIILAKAVRIKQRLDHTVVCVEVV